MADHDCKFEEKIIEMSGDIKCLLSEFKTMNGSLRDTKQRFDKHDDESMSYRHKIDILWSAVHTFKWATILLFGTGIFWNILERFIK